MLREVIDRSLRYRPLVLAALVATLVYGAVALQKVPVDAFPDVTPVQVGVVMEAPGMAAEDVERLLTFPLETSVAGLPGVQTVRSISIFGLSSITVYFRDDVDIYGARHLVFERLQQAKDKLPDGLGEPALAPNSSGLGQVYWYRIAPKSGATSLQDLRTIQDWSVRPILRTAPGVEDAISWGGHEKQFQIAIDPNRLLQYGLTLKGVNDALAANNRQVGGQYINVGQEQFLIRGRGLLANVDDIAAVIVGDAGGTPIFLRDIAVIAEGPAIRFGAVTHNGEEAVIGITLQRIGENAKSVVDGVKKKLAEIAPTLPKGVAIEPIYDRTGLVDAALGTARSALIEGSILVAIVLFLFLGELRSSLVVIATLPLAMLIAFILMERLGISANLMSLAGLAIGIGMIVDGAVVMVENAYRRLADSDPGHESRAQVIRHAAAEVIRPIAFAIAIIVVVFLPLFTLTDIEGKMFKPMALTITFAMLGSLLLAVTLVPVLCTFALRPGKDGETRVVQWITARYENLLDGSMTRRRPIFIGAVVIVALALALVPFLGREFMPTLQEGSFLFRITGIPSTSLETSIRSSIDAERLLAKHPEVATALATIGRAERGEPEDVSRIELLVVLKPRSEWPVRRSYEELGEELSQALQRELPASVVSLSQPIQSRVEELLSGIRAPLALKIYGEDLATLERVALEAREAIEKVPGVSDLSAEANKGKPELTIKVNRLEAARYGLNADDVMDVVQTGIGGKTVGVVLEGARRFEIQVRFAAPMLTGVEALRSLPIRTRSGAQVPLSRVADFALDEGYSFVRHEQLQRLAVLQMSVSGRDIDGFVKEARSRLESRVKLPAGYRFEWGGAFENQQRALAKLAIIVPLTIGFILFLLYMAFGTVRHAVLIIANVPFALVGGIVALFVSGQYLSVPSAIGFIAVFGVAMLNGIVLVEFMNQELDRGSEVRSAAFAAARQRLRPILMTASVTILGLLPMLLSRGIGAETQRPLATVVVGGLVTSTALTLILLPLIYTWMEERHRKRSVPAGELSER